MMIKRSIARERYDIPPWRMSEWIRDGLVRGDRVMCEEDDIRQLVGGPATKRDRSSVVRTPTRTDHSSDMISAEQAASMLGVSLLTIKNKINIGSLEGFGGYVKYSQVERLLEDVGNSWPIEDIAEEWGMSLKMLRAAKNRGLVSGPRDRIWKSCEKPLIVEGKLARRPHKSRDRGLPRNHYGTAGRHVIHGGSFDYSGYE